MSITSSNKLAVNSSLTVNGNTILGTNSSNTFICNASSSFYNPLTINGNIVQNSGTLNTTSDTNYLNGNVVIVAYRTLTTGGGTTTINGLTQANDTVYILSGKSLYITDAILSKYIRFLSFQFLFHRLLPHLCRRHFYYSHNNFHQQ